MGDSYDELAKLQAEHKYYLKLAAMICVASVLVFWQMTACTEAESIRLEREIQLRSMKASAEVGR